MLQNNNIAYKEAQYPMEGFDKLGEAIEPDWIPSGLTKQQPSCTKTTACTLASLHSLSRQYNHPSQHTMKLPAPSTQLPRHVSSLTIWCCPIFNSRSASSTKPWQTSCPSCPERKENLATKHYQTGDASY
jgi:hypothetical protein